MIIKYYFLGELGMELKGEKVVVIKLLT